MLKGLLKEEEEEKKEKEIKNMNKNRRSKILIRKHYNKKFPLKKANI